MGYRQVMHIPRKTGYLRYPWNAKLEQRITIKTKVKLRMKVKKEQGEKPRKAKTNHYLGMQQESQKKESE